jgi:hypothetical protein
MPEELDDLESLVGQWSMSSSLGADQTDAPRALTSFDWLPGKRFLIQRWEVDYPDAPDGIAIIGFDPDRRTYLQHYFDSRGVARIYDMDFAENVWTLQRIGEDPDFSQRFFGRFHDDGRSIVGRWDVSSDKGITWSSDF